MTEIQRRLKVFLCHAHSDAEAVRHLFQFLRREGVEVWLDKESLLPGADWELEIRQAVRESDIVVVCLSKQFNQAGFRQKEVRIALDTAMEKPEGEIFIIPARLEECDAPTSLYKWHWVDLFEEGGRQNLIRALRARADNVGAELRTRRGRPRVPLRLKSEEWAPLILRPRNAEKARTRSGIWVDHLGNVWRNSANLGRLNSHHEYKLLLYLIEHTGKWCTYATLGHVLEPEESMPPESIGNLVRNIRHVLKDNPANPETLMTNPRIGFKLVDVG